MTLLSLSSRSSVGRAPPLVFGSHGFNSCRGLRFFLCRTLESCWSIHLSRFNCFNMQILLVNLQKLGLGGLGLCIRTVSFLLLNSVSWEFQSYRRLWLHAVKFASTFGRLHWPTTWRSLSFFDLDRQVIDLNWKIAHGVLYTAQRLASFGLPVPLPCFCGSSVESLEHLFFPVPLLRVFCVGSSLLCSLSLRCAL